MVVEVAADKILVVVVVVLMVVGRVVVVVSRGHRRGCLGRSFGAPV